MVQVLPVFLTRVGSERAEGKECEKQKLETVGKSRSYRFSEEKGNLVLVTQISNKIV